MFHNEQTNILTVKLNLANVCLLVVVIPEVQSFPFRFMQWMRAGRRAALPLPPDEWISGFFG